MDDVTILGETNYRGKFTKFGIRRDDRRRHMYVIGKTGMGKTTFLENMVISDIRKGNGLCVVDPHGDFAHKMLQYVPSNRVNDVIYFDAGDINYPLGFNVMESVNPEYKHLVASGLLGVFKKIWADSWGPRLEYVLRNTILALLDYPGSTLLGIMRMLTDKSFRKKVISKVTDPVVKSFWVDEYSRYPDKFQQEAIAPIQNKVGQFLSISLIRNIVGQPKSTINMRDVIDSKKILLLNLSKGKVGEDASALFGAMMITQLQLAAMSRVDIQEEKRVDFYLYVDEFQNFATDSFADILSEARKYRLNLIMAHQYINQLPETVYDAVFGNVGTMIVFRIGAQDSEMFETEFEPVFTANHLVNLTKYNVYLKLMINGVASQAFSAQSIAPTWEPDGFQDKIIRISRERYAKKREIIEGKIARFSGFTDSTEPTKGEMESPKSSPRSRPNEYQKKREPKKYQNRSDTQPRQNQSHSQSKVNDDSHKPFKKAFQSVQKDNDT
ncbi:type IV secretion system DNA-binding domain-containing protein [Patescibacteria group bacterium]|nr:type IV secretion system DNA-binding domain-containing protein [Patescibacteria group bacterium]